MKQIKLRAKIIDELQRLESKLDGRGNNPFVVNVITFSGHGISFGGEAIAVIPEYENEEYIEGQAKIIRFINFTDWARKFAQHKNTLTVFILSMCRIKVKETEI